MADIEGASPSYPFISYRVRDEIGTDRQVITSIDSTSVLYSDLLNPMLVRDKDIGRFVFDCMDKAFLEIAPLRDEKEPATDLHQLVVTGFTRLTFGDFYKLTGSTR